MTLKLRIVRFDRALEALRKLLLQWSVRLNSNNGCADVYDHFLKEKVLLSDVW
jgi:hypothetical protein